MAAPAKSNGSNIKKSAPKAGKEAKNSGAATQSTPAVEHEQVQVTVGGKPDQVAYNVEMDKIKSEIDELQKQVAAVKEKINLASKSGGNDRLSTLKAELQEIRSQQGDGKASRGKIIEQLKTLQEGTNKKIKELQANKGKAPFKNVAELDAHVKKLEKQVEAGNMKLVDEKRALQEISTLKRQRRTIEAFQAQQDEIDAERAKEAELKKQLDDPQAKALSDKYESISAEIQTLSKAADEAYASRHKLYDERNAIQDQITALYNKKSSVSQAFRDAKDKYNAKIQEDRARRAERARASRAAAEEEKKKELATQIREEANIPAYQTQIEDCQTLIDFFSGNTSGSGNTGLGLARPEIAGVEKLEVRKVEEPEGMVARKKKGEEEEAYFVGKTKGKKGGKANGKANGTAAASTPANEKFSVPLAKLSALASLSIPAPTNAGDVPQTIENLKIKKEWFIANQAKQTAENKEKAEKEIIRLLGNTKLEDGAAADAEAETVDAKADAVVEDAGEVKEVDSW